MTTFKIDLTPVSHFFFGSEPKSELGNRQNYYAQSQLFPQQTTLLGMLRYQILLQENKIPITPANKGDSEKLIGERSFEVGKTNDFKKIRKLSPLFLSYNNQLFYIRDKEWVCKKNEKTGNNEEISLNFEHRDYPLLRYSDNNEGYLQKHPFVSSLCNYEDGSLYKDLNSNKVFIPTEQVGIRKEESQNKGDEGYFKRKYQGLKKGWSFTFFVEISEDSTFKLNTNERFVKLGKEQSMFKMQVDGLNSKFTFQNVCEKPDQINPDGIYKVILISDAYAGENLYKHCLLAMVDTIQFKNILTTTHTRNYNRKPSKSATFNLLKRGSLLYVKGDELENVLQKIKNDDFINIGYNYLRIIKN